MLQTPHGYLRLAMWDPLYRLLLKCEYLQLFGSTNVGAALSDSLLGSTKQGVESAPQGLRPYPQTEPRQVNSVLALHSL